MYAVHTLYPHTMNYIVRQSHLSPASAYEDIPVVIYRACRSLPRLGQIRHALAVDGGAVKSDHIDGGEDVAEAAPAGQEEHSV